VIVTITSYIQLKDLKRRAKDTVMHGKNIKVSHE